MTIMISSEFDGGNVDVVDAGEDGARLAIRRDAGSEFYQWFHFRVAGGRGRALTLRIENAKGAAYPAGWTGYRAVASEDRKTWRRVETAFDGETQTISPTPCRDAVWYAYFAPYSMERHADLLAQAQASPLVSLQPLGKTLDGQDLDLLRIGDGSLRLWTIARQHPGETMAEWWMEGFLQRLLDGGDACALELLRRATLFVVPNMNPDGSRRGHLRMNAVGANLNREWETPTQARSPEVALVRAAMEREGVDFCLDVHGDEALPYVFCAGAQGIPHWTERLAGLDADFRTALRRASPDFQTEHGYGDRGPANMTMCTPWVAERFDCLALTLEMPFKDNANAPDAAEGWSPARSGKLGAACLEAMLAVASGLR